jgi:hypothetical protein
LLLVLYPPGFHQSFQTLRGMGQSARKGVRAEREGEKDPTGMKAVCGALLQIASFARTKIDQTMIKQFGDNS